MTGFKHEPARVYIYLAAEDNDYGPADNHGPWSFEPWHFEATLIPRQGDEIAVPGLGVMRVVGVRWVYPMPGSSSHNEGDMSPSVTLFVREVDRVEMAPMRVVPKTSLTGAQVRELMEEDGNE